jgi:hypothetical protein
LTKKGSSEIRVKVSSSTTSIVVYTRIGDVPSKSFYTNMFSGKSIDFTTSPGADGLHIAIFNPSLDSSTSKFS